MFVLVIVIVAKDKTVNVNPSTFENSRNEALLVPALFLMSDSTPMNPTLPQEGRHYFRVVTQFEFRF